VTQENAALVEEAAAAAKSMQDQAGSLREQVAFFTVDGGAPVVVAEPTVHDLRFGQKKAPENADAWAEFA
jgi:methyl-accepting chemotaxis protein